MEVANPSGATGGDWRSQLDPMARDVMVKSIMETLKKHLPLSGPEGRNRLRDIAKGFEDRFYTEATNQSKYSRKIAMLLLHVETRYRAPGLPPQGSNPSHSLAVPSISQQQTRETNSSTSEQASSLPSVDQSLTGISQTSALQNMPGHSTIPQMQRMAMQSATQSGFQQNPLNTRQQSVLLLHQQSPQCVAGQQRQPQPYMLQQPSLQEAQPTQQPNIPLQQQQQRLMGQQPNLHQDQLIWQQSGAEEMQQPQRLPVQSNHRSLSFEAGNPRVALASSSSRAQLGCFENNADGEHVMPTGPEMETDTPFSRNEDEGLFSDEVLNALGPSEDPCPLFFSGHVLYLSPGHGIIEQDCWDYSMFPPASVDEEDGWLRSATLAAREDPNYVSMADGATNLKKRKFDGPSSAPVDNHSSAPVHSSPAIPEGASTIPSWVNLQPFQGWMSG